MSFKRKLVAALSTVALVPSVGAIVTPASAAAASSCADYAVLVVPGTSEIERGSTDKIGMLKNVTDPLKEEANQDFLLRSVDYPASVGGLIAPIYGGNTPFSDSVKEGIDLTFQYAREYKEKCSGIKMAIVGFSQGALVAGDATELIGNGVVDGLSSDDFFGSLLYADPRRARSQIDGERVQREGSEKTIAGLTDVLMEGEGIFGYRKDYGSMTSKTVSFCTTADSFCNMPEEGRPAADWLASLAEYNTGTNTEQAQKFQEVGYGEEARKVAADTPNVDGSPIINPEEIAENRAENPGSVISMVESMLKLAPKFIGDDPVAAFQQILGVEPENKSDAEDILREGLDAKSLAAFTAAFAANATYQGHVLYPTLPVAKDGTTATQWGANWLAARMK